VGAWARVFVHALSAELDYEEGRSAFEVTLLPDVFFLTSAELDFTMVAVAVPELRGRAPIPLREGLTIEPSTGQPGRSIALRPRTPHPPDCLRLPVYVCHVDSQACYAMPANHQEPVLLVVTASDHCGGA
jgi:hypothetical protein